MTATKTQARKMTTTYRNYWRVQMMCPQTGALAPHAGWIVMMERPRKGHQTKEEIIAEVEKVKQLVVEKFNPDNDSAGEFSDYQDYQVQILEWRDNVAELY